MRTHKQRSTYTPQYMLHQILGQHAAGDGMGKSPPQTSEPHEVMSGRCVLHCFQRELPLRPLIASVLHVTVC